MSAYHVSKNHVGFLVNLGQQLGLGGIMVGDSYRPLCLDDDHDRSEVARELINQNNVSVAYRYQTPPRPPADPPRFLQPPPAPGSAAAYAQALQWVACYRYQSCEDSNWPNSFACRYTTRLHDELVQKMIACFETTWDYDGAELVVATEQQEAAPSANSMRLEPTDDANTG